MNTLTKQEINEYFVKYCKHGNLQVANELLNLGADVRYMNDAAFRYGCGSGVLEIAKWLHSLGADIHAENDFAFRISCNYGHLETAKWLHSLGADIHSENDYAFIWACADGRIETAKWLRSLGADIHAQNDLAFIKSCNNAWIKIVKWLHSLCSDIHVDYDPLLQQSRKNGDIEMTKWLQGLIDTRNPAKITVKIAAETDLFYDVDGTQNSIKLVEPIAHNINSCTVKFGSVFFDLVSKFDNNTHNVLLPAGTSINQNGILTKLVDAKNFTLNKPFSAQLSKGTRLQLGSAHFSLENEVGCICEYA